MKRATREAVVVKAEHSTYTSDRSIYTDILNSDAKARATIRDLKARLEATREHIERTCPLASLSSDKCSCGECTAHNAADLTVKNWRKP